MHYLVTGASGFIGAALVEHLRRSGHAVTAVCRDGSHRVDFRTGNVPPDWLEGMDVVVHCAGIAHTSAVAADYRRVNTDAVLELAGLASDAGVGRFIFLSSVKAAQPTDDYGQSKSQAEQQLATRFGRSEKGDNCESSESSGMSVVLLRPSLVYGPGVKANLAALIRAVRGGLPTPPAGGQRSLLDREDLCELILELGGGTLSGVTSLTVSDGERYNLRRLHRAICVALHKSPPRAWLPRSGWWFASKLRDLLRGELSGEGTYQKLFGNDLHECNVASSGVDWRPRHTFESRLPDMVSS